jgi:hypothetical protein
MTIRGTVKIWDTNLVATAMLWARQHGYDALQNFIDSIYLPFWKRELDVESEPVIDRVLSEVGTNGAVFSEWAHTEGLAQNAQFQASAFSAGIYGVPTYVVGEELYFGREHLPRVRWQLTGQTGPAPDIGYTLPSKLPKQPELPARVTVGIDDSLDSLLALPQLISLLSNYSGDIDWIQIPPGKPPILPPVEDRSRSATHKRWRARNRAVDHKRYALSGAALNDLAHASHVGSGH